MQLIRILTFIILLPFAVSMAYSQGNIMAGKEAAKACVVCHGVDGNSSTKIYPKIAGQNQKYFIEQMMDFKAGEKSGRDNPIMRTLIKNLNQQDIANLAAYFSNQRMSTGKAKEKFVKLGRDIYRGGIRANGIPACSACHGPQGHGNTAAGFPALSGQHALYTEKQLKDYNNGVRRNDIHHIMQIIAKKLNDAQIKAVASYIEGLH